MRSFVVSPVRAGAADVRGRQWRGDDSSAGGRACASRGRPARRPGDAARPPRDADRRPLSVLHRRERATSRTCRPSSTSSARFPVPRRRARPGRWNSRRQGEAFRPTLLVVPVGATVQLPERRPPVPQRLLVLARQTLRPRAVSARRVQDGGVRQARVRQGAVRGPQVDARRRPRRRESVLRASCPTADAFDSTTCRPDVIASWSRRSTDARRPTSPSPRVAPPPDAHAVTRRHAPRASAT